MNIFNNLGAIADLGGLIISLGGFTLLYSTLKSQISVQEMQQEGLRLEQRKYQASIQPFFSCKFQHASKTTVTLRCRFRNGHAIKAKIMYKNRIGYFSYTNGAVGVYNWQISMLGNKLLDDDFDLNFTITPGHNDYLIRFYIIYFDITSENGYYQQIRYMHTTSSITYGDLKEYIHNVTSFPADFEPIPYL